MSFRRRVGIALALAFVPSVLLACMWDFDTLEQERSRFPTVLELITGKFPRHSRAFYEWRIQDREHKLQGDPDNLAYIDDLAVAYDKIGQHARAIDIMQAAEKKNPRRYETEANLGTFYIHAGHFKKGLEHIDQALRLNANAHFGREKYQRLLVQYLLTRRHGGKLSLPLAAEQDPTSGKVFRKTFAAFLRDQHPAKRPDSADRQAAIKGVLGMMRFGQFDSPILLEALGSLLSDGPAYPHEDAKRLAARAYLQASYAVQDTATRQDYRALAAQVLEMQTMNRATMAPLPLGVLESSFKEELAEAQAWYETVERDEQTWIREGKNPEVEFTRKYYDEPRILTEEDEGPEPWPDRLMKAALVVGGFGLCLVMVTLFLVWRSLGRRPRRSTETVESLR